MADSIDRVGVSTPVNTECVYPIIPWNAQAVNGNYQP